MAHRRPSITLGFSADRLSVPDGYAVFLTSSMAIPGTDISPFVSLKYGTADQRLAFPFGANLGMGPLSLQALYDGNYTHLLLSKPMGNVTVSFVLGRMKHPGLAIQVGF